MNKILIDSDIEKIKSPNTVLIGGCFDIIHPAHLEFIKKSKKLGENLVVLLENDINIAHLKGKDRPLNNQSVRAENLSKIEDVDYIIMLNTPISSTYYYNLVKSLEPAIIAITNGDPLTKIKKDQAKQVGGKVVTVMERDAKHSTTDLLKNGLL